MPQRILAVDYGEKRIGLALSDPLHLFATPYKTISNSSLQEVIDQLQQIITEQEVGLVLVGIPLSVDGNTTAKTIETQNFFQSLRNNLSVEVKEADERYTTSEANALLKEKGLSWKEARKQIDAFAACLILQRYLESNT